MKPLLRLCGKTPPFAKPAPFLPQGKQDGAPGKPETGRRVSKDETLRYPYLLRQCAQILAGSDS